MQLYHLSEGGGKNQQIGNDSMLWSQFRSGNRDALAQLYKEYRENLRKHGFSLCKDADLVNDSIHELFSRLWMHRERIGDAHNVRGYLYKSMDRILVAQL